VKQVAVSLLAVLALTVLDRPSGHAQAPISVPRVGVLGIASSSDGGPLVGVLKEALRGHGWIESRNVEYDVAFAETFEGLGQPATGLVNRKVSVIVTMGLDEVTLAARRATATIPIVMVFGVNPERAGLIAGIQRPGGNVTGILSDVSPDIWGKPEPDFYVVGMKSYGRAPTFLLLTGYEQVRSVVCALTGDVARARSVELTLPASGVCSTQPIGSPTSRPAPLGAAASCCGGPPPVNVVACCAQDAEAKAVGQEGCGCGSRGADAADTVSAAPCCSGSIGEAARTDGAEPIGSQIVPLHTLREGKSANRSCS
jgi:ABC transporter substrate binding protein